MEPIRRGVLGVHFPLLWSVRNRVLHQVSERPDLHLVDRYASVTVNTLVPLVFKQDMPVSESKFVSAFWANASAAGTLLAGVLCPFLGAAIDAHGLRKVTLVVTSIAMVLLLSLFVTMDPKSGWIPLVGVAVAGVMFYSTMQAVYNSLIVHMTDAGGSQGEDELAWISAVQCAIGNGGAMVTSRLHIS